MTGALYKSHFMRAQVRGAEAFLICDMTAFLGMQELSQSWDQGCGLAVWRPSEFFPSESHFLHL